MADIQPRPILITGGGRRIGLALARHFLARQQPVIISYRTWYPPSTRFVKRAPFVCTRISALTIAFWRSPKR